MLIFTSARRIFFGFTSFLGTTFSLSALMLWDLSLALGNLLTPKKKLGAVYAEGEPGHKGLWPEFRPARDGDSRCSCPAMNALCNHGLLPRDGRNIPFVQMTEVIHKTYNFAPSFCHFVPAFVANFLHRDYKTGMCDLSDIDVHNCIEHDASIIRHDAFFVPDQSKPALDLIDALLASASGIQKVKAPATGEEVEQRILTAADMSRFIEERRVHSKVHNPQYTLSVGQKLFGSSNCSTLLVFFGGIVSDLRIFLKEERLPDGWETKMRQRNGCTILGFNQTVNKVEFNVDESRERKIKGPKKPFKPPIDNAPVGMNGEISV